MTVEAAKVAPRADYERRILSALAPAKAGVERDARLVEEQVASWPAIKKALWRVVTGETLNDGHYINAMT